MCNPQPTHYYKSYYGKGNNTMNENNTTLNNNTRPKGFFKRIKATTNLTADVLDTALVASANITGDVFGTLEEASQVGRQVASDSMQLWAKESKIEALQDGMELDFELRKTQVAYNARMAELDTQFSEQTK